MTYTIVKQSIFDTRPLEADNAKFTNDYRQQKHDRFELRSSVSRDAYDLYTILLKKMPSRFANVCALNILIARTSGTRSNKCEFCVL